VSFILDALRKSESERQRDAAPSLSRIPEAIAPRRLPFWAAGTIALLGLGVLGLGAVLWLGGRERAPTSRPETAASGAPQQSAVPSLPDAGAAQTSALGSPAARAGAGTQLTARIPARTALSAAPGSEQGADAARGADTRPAPGIETSNDASDALGASSAGPAATNSFGGAPESSDLEGAAGATALDSEPAPTFLGSYETAATSDSALPKLQLELHAFADDPARRFVYINGEKYSEGATLKEGPRVVRITADGVILEVAGRQLLLARK
jgi:general secretion pathway protein B